MDPPQNWPLTIGFGLWATCYAVLSLDIAWMGFRNGSFLLAVFYLLVLGTMEIFLLFKTASSLPFRLARLVRYHTYYYETKEGSYMLLTLCVVWMLGLFIVAPFTWLDILMPGGTIGTWTKLAQSGSIGSFLAGLLQLCYTISALSSPGLFIYILWTAIKAGRRAAASPSTADIALSQEDEEGVPNLISTGEHDEWDDWRDNRGV